MKKPLGRLAAVATAAAACLLAVPPATAAPSTVWTVTPSGPVSLVNSTNLAMSVNGLNITCTRSTGLATLRSATGNPAVVGSVDALAFGATGAPCTSALGPMTMTPVTPWAVLAQDHDATTGVTKGHLDRVDIKMNAGPIVFRVKGKVAYTYTDTTGRLTVTSAPGQLLVTESANGGVALPVGSSLIGTGTYLVKAAGTTTGPAIIGTHP
ncbi:hypothetical protein ABZ618_29585 [Streptomyces roseolus]|uniref:hypothetical protein n=1 Tax=Streptomyces roseolus TaxID=67358 RepID=UPI0033D0D2ED